MNIFDNKSAQQQPPQDPLKILQQAEALLSSKEKRQGWPYYDLKHATNFAQMVVKLLNMPGKKASISSIKLRQQPQTLRARLSQGKAFIVDKGVDVLRGCIPDEHLPLVAANADKVQVSVRKVNLIIEIAEPVEDMLEAMVALGSDDMEVYTFNEEIFREEVREFINSAPEDTQQAWENYTASAEKYARQLALQDKNILIETSDKTLIIMKMSEEMMKGLE